MSPLTHLDRHHLADHPPGVEDVNDDVAHQVHVEGHRDPRLRVVEHAKGVELLRSGEQARLALPHLWVMGRRIVNMAELYDFITFMM